MIKKMRIFLAMLVGAVIGAVTTTFIAFVSARPFWPPEIGFGKNPNDYLLFLALNVILGCVLGIVSGFIITASPATQVIAARISIIIGVLIAVFVAPVTWMLGQNSAWPLLRASDTLTAGLEDFGPFIICWFPLLWAILLAVCGFRQSSRNNA